MNKQPSITDKVDAITKIGDERIQTGGFQPAPKSVKIEITARCNLRCKYCGLSSRAKQPTRDMPLDFFKRITTDMRQAGVEEIGVFYLGESFMAPDLLIDAVKWCKQELAFPWVFLTSNATRAYPEFVNPLFGYGLDSLKWSTNFRSPGHFRAMTGASGKLWGRALANIQDAFYIRSKLKAKTILSASSIIFYDDDQFKKMRAFVKDHIAPYVDRHYWLPTYQMGMASEKIRKELGVDATVGNMGRIDERTMLPNRAPLPCWAVFTEGHVRVDGGLSACCFGADDRFDMGILDGKNFMDQWNSPKFQTLRDAHIATMRDGSKALENTPCRTCVTQGK